MAACNGNLVGAHGGEPFDSIASPFVRLRYFFGKRMTVADFVDQERYHARKLRFHNQRLHGSGVVAGLHIGFGAGSATSLRIGRGAAIDGSGRELVVGCDQCVDAAAWYQRALAERRPLEPTWPRGDLDHDERLVLYVGLRYAECLAGPEPAPRDVCGCDDGGYEPGRVSEGFELALLTSREAQPSLRARARVTLDELDGAPALLGGRPVLDSSAATAVMDALGDGRVIPPAEWLLLYRVRAKIDDNGESATGRLVSIELDPALLAPPLLSSAQLQELLLRGLAASVDPSALAADAPQITDLTLENEGGSMRLRLGLSGPVVAPTVATGGQWQLCRLDPATGWQSPLPVNAAYAGPDHPALVLALPAGSLAAGGLYRLSFDGDGARPIVNERLQPLVPRRFAREFTLVGDGTETLRLAPLPAAVAPRSSDAHR